MEMLHIKSFSIFGLDIALYGVVVAIGMLAGVLLACKTCKHRNIKTDDIFVLALYCLPLAVIGARLYYVIFSGYSYTFVEIWQGGLAIYGGVIGGAVGVVLYCLIHKKNFFDIADIAVVSLILGQAIGRIACYFGDCCYGVEITNPTLQWFPLGTFVNGAWHYSTFFYESFCNFGIFVLLLLLLLKKVKTRGVMLCLYLICYGAVRCVIETFRGDSLYIGSLKVSQLLSLLLMVAGIVLLVVIYTKKRRNKTSENFNNTQNS